MADIGIRLEAPSTNNISQVAPKTAVNSPVKDSAAVSQSDTVSKLEPPTDSDIRAQYTRLWGETPAEKDMLSTMPRGREIPLNKNGGNYLLPGAGTISARSYRYSIDGSQTFMIDKMNTKEELDVYKGEAKPYNSQYTRLTLPYHGEGQGKARQLNCCNMI